jgi:predicted secreted hydrolase
VKPVQKLLAIFTVLAVFSGGCGPGENSEQGSDFAVLAQHAEGYEQARPGQPLSFPLDHGPHPGYRIEWWYLTANLSDTSGRSYGAQWTLFRLSVHPPETRSAAKTSLNNQVFMAHVAVTTPDDHVSFQRYARGGENQESDRAGVTSRPFFAWLDDWALKSTGPDWLPLEVQARQDDYALHLQLDGNAPPVVQGDAGFSQKHTNGGGSIYYSQPFLQASGVLLVNGETIAVSGDAWLDREWSSQFLQADQSGWDWFSLHLDSGEKLVLFQLRQLPGSMHDDNFLYGRLIAADGEPTALVPELIKLTVLDEAVVAGRSLPVHWRIELPQIDRLFELKTLHPRQWMNVDFPYWEGVITVTGSGPGNRGRGYMELTGYPKGTERKNSHTYYTR